MQEFSWDPYPANSGVSLGLEMMADFHFCIYSVNESKDISELFILKRKFLQTFKVYNSIDPLLSLLDDVEIAFEIDSVPQIDYDSSKKR